MTNQIKRPLPDMVAVPSAALAQIINALNGPQYMILELLHTRSLSALGVENPIDIIEDRLLKYQSGETPPVELVASISVNVDNKMLEEAFEGILKNYRRIGADVCELGECATCGGRVLKEPS